MVMRPAKKEKPSGRVRAGALVGIAILALVGMGAGVAGAQTVARQGTVVFHGRILGAGEVAGSGDVIGYYTAPGCYVVQMQGRLTPIVACGKSGARIGIGRRVRVDGFIERTVRQRQGPFLDVVPLVRGTVELEGKP